MSLKVKLSPAGNGILRNVFIDFTVNSGSRVLISFCVKLCLLNGMLHYPRLHSLERRIKINNEFGEGWPCHCTVLNGL